MLLWLQARKRIAMILSAPSASPAFNPYLPLVGRLFDVLLSAGAPGTTIEICNRTLAELAHCSAGAIPAALRRLEADGYIERVVTSQGSLIVVTERSDMPDRNWAAALPESTETPDRPAERSEQRSAMADPPRPPTWNQHESHEQQQRTRESLLGELIAAGAATVLAAPAAISSPRSDSRVRCCCSCDSC